MLFGSRSAPEKLVVDKRNAQRKSYAWHAHDYREVLSLLNSSINGLAPEEVLERRKKFGENRLSEIKQPGILSHTFKQLRSPLPLVLLIAVFVTITLAEYVDAGVIFAALAIAVAVGVFQEERASRAFGALKKSESHRAIVIRGGKRHEVDVVDLVPGDMVEVGAGMQVPADLRTISSKKLSVNESALTGEWRAVKKMVAPVHVGAPLPERANMLWRGTFVTDGYGTGVVVATGDGTILGNLSVDLQTIENAETPLQLEMKKISRAMLMLIIGLVALIFGVGLLNGEDLSSMFLMAIAIAVASVPEGLPAAVIIILAAGMEALLRRGGLVRNLLAAETLGSTTYILTDKTGTLTEGRMSLEGIIRHDTANLDPGAWEESPLMQNVLRISLNAGAAFVDSANGKSVMKGDPIEQAILEAALRAKIVPENSDPYASRIDYLAFDPDNRFAAGLVAGEKENRICINGAPEYLLSVCEKVLVKGEERKLTDAEVEHFTKVMRAHTREGKRLLGVAYKDVKNESISENDEKVKHLPQGAVFVGLLIFNDKVRADVKESIKGVRGAGATIVLVTGDNADTALAVAKSVGIAGVGDNALTGEDLEEMSDSELLFALDSVRVFARVLPHQKLRLAELLQSRGEIVAMTGDGVNDSLALRKANIGVAIGSGTEIAKEASDLILLKDSFAVIYAAIEEGRRIVSNLRKVVGYLISTSLTEVVLIGTALLSGAALPILPVQILWANLIEEGFMSLAFAFEPGEKGAMKQRPQDIYEEGILSPTMMWFTGFVVSVLGLLIVAFYFYLRALELPIDELRSIMFLAISMDSLFMAFAFRSFLVPLWKQPLRTNLFFVGSFFLSGLALLAVLTVPLLQELLSYTPLPLNDIVMVLIFSVASLLTVEVGKWIFFSGHRTA